MEYDDADGDPGSDPGGDKEHAVCVNDMASIRAAIERLIAE